MRRRCLALACSATTLLAAGVGCHRAPAPADEAEAPTIPISHPIAREITDFRYYTGRIAAVEAVDIRPRVSGYIVKTPFVEGAEVKKGDLLFEIDVRPYQAQLDAQTALSQQKEANYRLSRSENRRSQAIASKEAGFIAPEDLEKSSAAEVQAQADLNLARANVDLAKLNVEFTRVISPIDGLVSRYNYTVGNLVTQDQSLLTTVVSVDPMYTYFDVDERTVVRVRQEINEGRLKAKDRQKGEIPVNIALEGEAGYPHQGTVNFLNNVVTSTTGTLTFRGVFANPKPPTGRRVMTPGMFVRVQLPMGEPHQALLIAERAVGSDQGVKFVYVVDAERKVQYRRIELGEQQDDGLRAIASGLKPDDWVVVGGLPQIRPRMAVQTEEAPMPTLNGPEAPAPANPPASPGGAPAKPAPEHSPPPPAPAPKAPAQPPATKSATPSPTPRPETARP